jgi:hypothetical protein
MGAGWKLIYGLNLQINNSSTAATQAGLIATAMGGGANVVFQFGNEAIGNYVTKTQYETNWNAYYTAVLAAVTGLKVAATDSEDFGDTQVVIAALTPGVSGMTYVTQHWYGALSGSPYTVASASQMISTVAINYYVNSGTGAPTNPYSGYEINNNWAQANNVKLQLSESNNINNGGLSGYSNRMMSAAWYLNEAIAFANMGWNGINTHLSYGNGGGGPGIYKPIVSADGGVTYQAAPEFYGLYLFAQIEGQQTVQASVGGNANVAAIATQRAAGKANILVVNNDSFSSATITPGQSAAWSTANVLQMKTADGTGCYDPAPVLGGQIIGKGGAWSGIPFSISNGQSINLGPCEAALISIQ